MSLSDALFVNENIESIPQVETIVQSISNRFELSPDQHGNILISLTEAVTNAFVHGNKNDKTKCVKMRVYKVKDSLAFQVSDEGPGFDHTSLPDPTLPENLLKLNGRGVFIMHQLCDKIEYKNDGRTVEMSFHICTQ